MHNRMNDEARPEVWIQKAARFLLKIWAAHETGNVFVGTRSAKADRRWQEHPITLPVSQTELIELFQRYHRVDHDLYFCANAFRDARRKKSSALRTPYACVDVDNADLSAFKPKPNLAWQTSPGRKQAIWTHGRKLRVEHAEQIARNLAYTYGADKNGWSVTKYLRVPHTYNHKPEYDRPEVIMVSGRIVTDELHVAPKYIPETKQKRRASPRKVESGPLPSLPTGDSHRKALLKKFGSRMGMMPRILLGHDRLGYPDRSQAIYAIVAGLKEAGAARRDIEIALWNSVYFRDKHGLDRCALVKEITRILEKLGVTQ